MAKDPAVLFYTSDFLSGTFTMSNEQVGKYIRLLCLQHQKGQLTEKDMLSICKAYDDEVYSKFEKQGEFYCNIRMKIEAERRRKFSESRRNNAQSINNQHKNKKAYAKHMETETETINDNEIKTKKFIPPEKLEIINYMAEKLPDNEAAKQSDLFYNYYESNGWKVGKNKMKDWKAAASGWVTRSKDFKTTNNGTSKTEQLAADVQEAFNRRFGNVQ